MMIPNDVPTAKCITYSVSIPEKLNMKNNIGTVTNPPPIPKSPAANPAGIAVAIINKTK